MLKIKAPLKKLSAAVALGLFAGTASASVSIYDTFHYGINGHAVYFAGEWGAGRFTVSPSDCPSGCYMDSAILNLWSPEKDLDFKATLEGVTLSVYSNNFLGGDDHLPGVKLFDLIVPSHFYDDGSFGTNVSFSAPGQDPAALLQPHTAYWIKLTNESRSSELGWGFNGAGHSGEYWAELLDFGNEPNLYYGHGAPFIFEITASPVPIPGAIWLMGTAMIGLLTSWRRKLA